MPSLSYSPPVAKKVSARKAPPPPIVPIGSKRASKEAEEDNKDTPTSGKLIRSFFTFSKSRTSLFQNSQSQKCLSSSDFINFINSHTITFSFIEREIISHTQRKEICCYIKHRTKTRRRFAIN